MFILKALCLVASVLYFQTCAVTLSYCLEPSELLVVANSRMAGSVDVAKFYLKKRQIPDSHLLALPLSLEETISRKKFNKNLKDKILKKINRLEKTTRIAAIVLMYGVPLKVDAPRPSWKDLDQIREIEKKIAALRSLDDKTQPDRKKKIQLKEKKLAHLSGRNKRAAVDSELSLVKINNYDLEGWIRNPFFVGHANQTGLYNKNQILLVTRLDGPDPDTVYRVIEDSLHVENTGLKGVAYFDARWPFNTSKNQSGYALYDTSLHLAAAVTQKRMKSILDDREQLFGVQSCPSAALYCGWYSLARYVDSFEWVRGAVGYHIASGEADTLRDKTRSTWCLKMLQKGVAATIGPVYEPYVQGFPQPEIFFTYLTEGYLSLGEVFLVSQPYLSWQTIMIGDPLYQPFKPKKK